MRTGIYAGSFDPFHRGHKHVVDVAAKMFDPLIVLVAHNPDKKRQYAASASLGMIAEYARHRGYTNLEPGLIGDASPVGQLAAELRALLVRGIRCPADLAYEQNLAAFNRDLFGVETVLIPSPPELAHVSSSAIRELIRLGLDHGRYL